MHNENLKKKLNENQNILKFNLIKIKFDMKSSNYNYNFEEENCLSDTTYSDFNSNNKILHNDKNTINYVNNTLLEKTKAILNNHFRTLNIEDFTEQNIKKKEFININELNKININKKIINILHKKSIKKKNNQKPKLNNYKDYQINSIERNNNFEIKTKNIKNDSKKIIIENNTNNFSIIKSNFKPIINENNIELKQNKEINFKIEKDKIFEYGISKVKNNNCLNKHHNNFEYKEIKEINFEINAKNKYNKIYKYEVTKEINFEKNQNTKNNYQNLILPEYQLNSFFLNIKNKENLNKLDKNKFIIIHENSENFTSSNQEIQKNYNSYKKEYNKIKNNKKEKSNIENKKMKKKIIKSDFLKEQKEQFNLKLFNIINNEKELNINKILHSNRQLTLPSTHRESKLSNFYSDINSPKNRNSYSSLNLIEYFFEEEKRHYENKTLNLKSNLSYNRVIKNCLNKDFNVIKRKKELKRIHSANEKVIKKQKEEYIDLKNEINILKKERDFLLSQKNQVINNEKVIQNKPKEQIKIEDNKLSKSVNILEIEKKYDILFEKKLLEDELFKNLKYENKFDNLSQDSLLKSHDSFGEYVDKIIKRSYRLYTKRNCNVCVDLLSKGKSTKYCYKSHHKFKKIK